MVNYSLMFVALLSFSIVTNAAAIPRDAGKAAVGATQNADLHREVPQAQGGNSDKDVVEVSVVAEDLNLQHVSNAGMLSSHDSSALQPFLVAVMIIVLIVVVLSRKSISTK